MIYVEWPLIISSNSFVGGGDFGRWTEVAVAASCRVGGTGGKLGLARKVLGWESALCFAAPPITVWFSVERGGGAF